MEIEDTNLNSFTSAFSQFCIESDEGLKDWILDETVKHIRDASILLKCTFKTRTKALLIYHYFRRCVHQTRYDPYMIAAACLSLSVKYNEESLDLDAIILMIFRMIDHVSRKSINSEEFKTMKRSLIKVELLILRMVEFSLHYAVAHEYLAYFVNDLSEDLSTYNIWNVFIETCTRLACDFYLSKKCLNYKAEDIAVTIVQASLYLIGIDVDRSRHKSWLKTLNDCPENNAINLLEDMYGISDIGPFLEKRARNAVSN